MIRGFRLFYFTMFYPSNIFREIGPPDLLAFAHQSFLKKLASLIYYVIDLVHFIEICPSDLLRFRSQPLVKKSHHLIYYVLALIMSGG